MRNKFRYIISLLILSSTFSVSAMAQGSEIKANKTATYDYEKHEGELTMEAYLTGTKSSIMKTAPVDVVMVLDWSTSMWDNSKIVNLTTAAKNFVDKIAGMSTSTVQHRISVVTFATGATMRSDFLSMSDASNVTMIKNLIEDYGSKSDSDPKHEKIKEGGTTHWHLAMCLAYNIMKGGTVFTRFYGWKHTYNSTQVNYGDTYNGRTESQDNSHNVNFDGSNFQNNYIYSRESDKLGVDEWAQQVYNAKKDRDKDGKYEDIRGNRAEVLGGKRSDAKGFVIFFTDGQPTGVKNSQAPSSKDLTDYSKYWTGGDSDRPNYVVANIAINYAYKIKRDANIKIYSIKLGKISTTKIDNFADDALKNISSMYPDAERYGTSYRGTASTETAAFFQKVESEKDGSALDVAFNNITNDIKEIVNKDMDAHTSNIDFINNAYFKLPEGITSSSIRVYKNDLKSFDGTTYTFYPETDATHWKDISSSVNVRVVANGDGNGNDMIVVTGYDYAANWCGVDESKSPAEVHGARLVYKVPFVFSDGEIPGEYATNTSASGVYPVQRDEHGDPILDEDGNPKPDTEKSGEYPVPTIKFCIVTVVRENLEPGESAIYEVTDQNGKFICRLSLGGVQGATSVRKSIYGLPGGDDVEYTVTETGWNWAYDKDSSGGTATRTVSDPDVPVVFEFSGRHKTADEGPAERQNHGESFKVNLMRVP